MGMSIDEKCYLYGSCKCQTAGCVVRPDNGCPVYRYFKGLIVKDQYEARKNDLAQERYQDLIEHFGDEKVAKAILESRKEFKAWLERIRWNVKRVDELARELEQIKPIAKNDLGVDCISRDSAIKALDYDIESFEFKPGVSKYMDDIAKLLNTIYEIQVNNIKALSSVTPQEPKTGHWIEHEWQEMREKGYFRCSVCNHGYQRYAKGIRKSDVPYIDGQEYILWNCDNYCPNCGAQMVDPQERSDKA